MNNNKMLKNIFASILIFCLQCSAMEQGQISQQSSFMATIGSNDIAEIEQELKAGMNPNFVFYGYSPLTLAADDVAADDADEKVVELLLRYNADVNMPNWDTMTPLMYAAKRGNASMVQLLLAHKAKVNIADQFNNTALTFAAQNGDKKIYNMLVAAGATQDARSGQFHRTPREIMQEWAHQSRE
jgi:hypothetical protein